jgi:hypothetical protein
MVAQSVAHLRWMGRWDVRLSNADSSPPQPTPVSCSSLAAPTSAPASTWRPTTAWSWRCSTPPRGTRWMRHRRRGCSPWGSWWGSTRPSPTSGPWRSATSGVAQLFNGSNFPMNGEGARIADAWCYLMSELGTQFYIWSNGWCGW